MKWYRVNLSGSFYDDMIGKFVSEEPCTMSLDFGTTIGTAIFLKEYLVEEIIDL